MKDPTIGITRAFLNALTASFTVNGQTVKSYATAPTKAPDNFVWVDVVDFNDIGTKDSFTTEVRVDLVVVTRVNTTQPTTLLLDSISTTCLQTLVQRGSSNLTDPTGDLTIFGVTLSGIINGKDVIDNKTEIYKRLQLTVLCQEN